MQLFERLALVRRGNFEELTEDIELDYDFVVEFEGLSEIDMR